MNFEEMFKNWTLDQKVEWALGPNICNLSNEMRSIFVDLWAENKLLTVKNERLKAELEKDVTRKIVSEHCNSLQSEIKILEKRNDELRCLALHGISEYLWLRCLNQEKGKRKWELYFWSDRCHKAYRKAKAELKEKK